MRRLICFSNVLQNLAVFKEKDFMEFTGCTFFSAEDAPIYCICRSGARSASAASALTEAGFSNCFNVAEGFEGDLDDSRHRGQANGWKARGLPWIQS